MAVYTEHQILEALLSDIGIAKNVSESVEEISFSIKGLMKEIKFMSDTIKSFSNSTESKDANNAETQSDQKDNSESKVHATSHPEENPDKPSSANGSSIQSTLRYQRVFLLFFFENCTISPLT